MPLSSNWKALQTKLKAQQSPKGTNENRKRKRPSHAHEERPVKKVALAPAPSRRKAMGIFASKPAMSARPSTEDKSDATETIRSTFNTGSSQDLLNRGLHQSHRPGKYLALDCEMVGAGPPPSETNVLARVSIVNYNGEQIYDSYVLPEIPITDYRTHVSGIRPEHLRPGIARPFKQVRDQVIRLLDGRILVGHALKSDLDVLVLASIISRANIRDTSRYPKYRALASGKTPSLKKLAKEVLEQEIQTGEHDSVIDARTAMQLFRRDKADFEADSRRKWGSSAS